MADIEPLTTLEGWLSLLIRLPRIKALGNLISGVRGSRKLRRLVGIEEGRGPVRPRPYNQRREASTCSPGRPGPPAAGLIAEDRASEVTTNSATMTTTR